MGNQGIEHIERKDGYEYNSGTFYYDTWNSTLFKINEFSFTFDKPGFAFQKIIWEDWEIISSEAAITAPLQLKKINLFNGKTITVHSMPYEMELERSLEAQKCFEEFQQLL